VSDLHASTPSVSPAADFSLYGPNQMGRGRKALVENGPEAPISDFPVSSRSGEVRRNPDHRPRSATSKSCHLPAVVLESELEIAKGVGPRLPPRYRDAVFFDCSWPKRVGDPTQARRARKPACLDPTGWVRSGKLFLIVGAVGAATTRHFQP